MKQHLRKNSNVKVHAKLVIEFVEFLANSLAHDANLTVFAIILNAVFED